MRIGVSGAFVWFVVWHIICMNLFPISLAYLEYKNELTDEYVGVIQHIEQRDKERIYITIDDTEFIIAHNLTEPIFEVGKDFDRGNTVKIEFGEKSKFVFNIYEQSDLS